MCSISVGAVCGVLVHMRGLSLVVQAKLGQVNDTIKTNNPWGTTFVLAYAAPHPAPIKEGAQVNPNWRVFVVFHFCKVCMLYYFATDINSWDGLVGYDAAFTLEVGSSILPPSMNIHFIQNLFIGIPFSKLFHLHIDIKQTPLS